MTANTANHIKKQGGETTMKPEELICKAQRKDNGEWIEGFYFCLHHNDGRTHLHHLIIPLEADLSKGTPIDKIQVEIEPESITLKDKLKESRISLKEIMDESLTELIETNKLKPPRVLTIDDMQATKKGQFLWIECLGGELYCMEAVQVCKANGKVTEISINAPRFIYELTMRNYNIGWRAWDSQPTPAMMEAMPWKS